VRADAASSPPRRARRLGRGVERRRSRRGAGQATAVALIAAVLLTIPLPVRDAVACPPVGPDVAVTTVATLADDGEVTRLDRRLINADATTCLDEGDGDAAALGVAVAVLHEDASGRSLEATELTQQDGPVLTRVAVRDVTARERQIEVDGPRGRTMVSRLVGVPQVVRVAVRYPPGWQVTAAAEDGTAVTLSDSRTEVARTAVLFPPLLADELVLAVLARPAAGTPSVTVDASPLAGMEPFVLEALDPDVLAVVGALGELAAEGAAQLADGAGELAEGTRELAAGTRDLADGTIDLADGTRQLAGGAEELAGGARALSAGSGQLADGAGELAAGAADGAAGAQDLAGGSARVAGGVGELVAGASDLAAGATELAAGARSLADGLAVGVEAVPDVDPAALVAQVAWFATQVAAVRDQLAAVVPPGTDPTDPTDPNAPLALAVPTLTAVVDGLGGLATGLETAVGEIAAALDGLATAADGAGQLADGADALAVGAAALAVGAAELAAGAEVLAAGTDELAGGLQALAVGADGIASGAREVAAGSAGLADGSAELAVGTGTLADGAASVADGTVGLAAGADELADGTAALAAGAQELPPALTELTGVADRSGQDLATTAALLAAGSELAQEAVGDAALVTAQLTLAGEEPFPLLAVLGGSGTLLVAAIALLTGLRRRWPR
jgi:X-X-X-Leu-X-X-Gly heptad repeat protein